MNDQTAGSEGMAVDSRTAARGLARTAMISVVVGAVTGLATWLFIAADHYGAGFLWEELPELVTGVPGWAVPVGVVLTMTLLATLVVILAKGRPFDTGHAEAEYDKHGRMEYRHLIGGSAFSLFSLFSGAAVGPEAPLTDINGGIGTFIAERLRLTPEQVKVMAYAGVAGAFSAFFGAAPIGALLAAELISPKAVNISRTQVVSGLASGATGWVVYAMLGGGDISPILTFPGLETLRLADIGFAALLGVVGGVLGLVYGGVFVKTRVALHGLRQKPALAGLAGGVVLAVAAATSPYLLFSGQAEAPQLIADAATLGVLVLVGLGVAKLALSIWCLSTAYFGGPIFPLIFAGTCFGLAVNLLIPGIPQGVAVLAIVTGMVVAAAVAPLSVTIFLALLSDPTLVSVIAIAAVFGFVVRQLIAPTLPGVYRATRAAEKERVVAAEEG